MRVDLIRFIQGEKGAVPNEITVTMSLMEAAVIGKVFGGFNAHDYEKREIPEIDAYNDLCGNVFNRYWEDGLDGAMRELKQT